MQLLYGNDGINYRTIDKSPDMSEGVEKAILGTYSKYEFVSNPRAYSNEPEAVTYVTSNLDRQLPEDRMVVCKAGHMRNFSSHCSTSAFENEITSSTSQFNAAQILLKLSIEMNSFRPILAKTLKLIPAASFRSVRFIFLSISIFHNLS